MHAGKGRHEKRSNAAESDIQRNRRAEKLLESMKRE
jgi:hypothetical protein